MSNSFKRSERVADLIMKEVSNMIVMGEIKDPRVKSASITGVKVSDNLSVAEMFYTVVGEDDYKQAVRNGLESATGFIRNKLAARLKMRRIPELKFSYDVALDKAYKLDDALREIKDEQ